MRRLLILLLCAGCGIDATTPSSGEIEVAWHGGTSTLLFPIHGKCVYG